MRSAPRDSARQLAELQAQVRELAAKVATLSTARATRGEERPAYLLSPADRQRAAAERARNLAFASRTGSRPLEGGPDPARTDLSPLRAGIAFDTLSDDGSKAVKGDKGPPGAGLPVGQSGDILYHNGSAWVVLVNPGAATPNVVLCHDGTVPYWSNDIPTAIDDIEDRLDNASGTADLSLDCEEDPPKITGDITITI